MMKNIKTRAQLLNVIAAASMAQLREGFAHPSNRVQRAVARRIAHLERMAMPKVVKEPSEFEKLVEKFRAMGKPNPEASARASMAASKQAAMRRQTSMAVA